MTAPVEHDHPDDIAPEGFGRALGTALGVALAFGAVLGLIAFFFVIGVKVAPP